jgi:hypothetical protein
MVCNRSDYVAVTSNVELRSIPGFPALAQRFLAAGRTVHARLGRGAIDAHVGTGPGRVRERARDLAIGLRAVPALRLVAIGWWCVTLGAVAGIAASGTVGWVLGGALYVACALQVGVLLRRVGAYGWTTALLYPLPLLAFAGALLWSLVPGRVTRSR